MRMPWLFIAALFGALAVIMGAAGAHSVDDGLRSFYDTAVLYNMFHVFPLIVISFLVSKSGAATLFASSAGLFFVIGIILFSGSLYYLGSTGEPLGYFITPAGGMALIAGWLFLAICGALRWLKGDI